MPNPINRIVADAHIALEPKALGDKPEMAILVTEIFAIWAQIEHDLSLLLARILGAAESPALAMFSVLHAQHLQLKALQAAAEAALDPDGYEVFLAVLSVTEGAQTPRNRLAHWVWGTCKQRPDLLCLADPEMLRDRDLRVARYFQSLKDDEAFDWQRTWDLYQFDSAHVFGYSKADLERAKKDLIEAKDVLFECEFYLNPTNSRSMLSRLAKGEDPVWIRAEILRRLNDRRLFREALDRIRADRKSTPPQPSESPQPKPGE